jgi:hypothetical protein
MLTAKTTEVLKTSQDIAHSATRKPTSCEMLHLAFCIATVIQSSNAILSPACIQRKTGTCGSWLRLCFCQATVMQFKFCIPVWLIKFGKVIWALQHTVSRSHATARAYVCKCIRKLRAILQISRSKSHTSIQVIREQPLHAYWTHAWTATIYRSYLTVNLRSNNKQWGQRQPNCESAITIWRSRSARWHKRRNCSCWIKISTTSTWQLCMLHKMEIYFMHWQGTNPEHPESRQCLFTWN